METLDAEPRGSPSEVGIPDPIVIVNQISRLAFPGCGFDQLPPDPGGGALSSHLEVDKFATAVANEGEDVEGLEGLGDWSAGADDSVGSIGR